MFLLLFLMSENENKEQQTRDFTNEGLPKKKSKNKINKTRYHKIDRTICINSLNYTVPSLNP